MCNLHAKCYIRQTDRQTDRQTSMQTDRGMSHHTHTYLVLGMPAYSATSQWKEASTFCPNAPSYNRPEGRERDTSSYHSCPQRKNTEMVYTGL